MTYDNDWNEWDTELEHLRWLNTLGFNESLDIIFESYWDQGLGSSVKRAGFT